MTEEQRDMLLVAAVRYCRGGLGKRIRQGARMSQQEMARRVGVDTSALWRWEHGKRRPRDDAAVKWAQELMWLELASAATSTAA
ncbi:helix-turn-helix domain-containing protein [Actinoplanes sp. NPDC051494]|uniref:helix-turn-helix domain-containing protein n=1 Tax=Actinoplanes sp. NPDC051494 TaxID=3363907 RepID=UPI0037A5816E